MSRGGAHFTSKELDSVLGQYDIGKVQQTLTLATGNKRSPKKIIVTEWGMFLLKRRAKGKDDIYHVGFAHSVQMFLKNRGYPVAGLVATLDNNTVLNMDGHTYELFCFIPGGRFDESAAAVRDAGRQLAKMHDHFVDFECDWRPLKRTYHDSSAVRGHLDRIGSERGPHKPGRGWAPIARELKSLYDISSETVNGLGFADWPDQIVHGDWHPGNMLFVDGKVSCVLDFDSAKIAPVMTDLANGVLQFSIVAGRPNPADWPAYLDGQKLGAFVDGYQQLHKLGDEMLRAIGDLMIEIMIAEAVMPIAATGFFGHLSGLDFLEMILRKCRWIDDNRQSVDKDIIGKG